MKSYWIISLIIFTVLGFSQNYGFAEEVNQNDLCLIKGDFSVRFSPKTGAISKMIYKDEVFLLACADEYELITKMGEKTSSELQDEVIKVRQEKGKIVFDFINPTFPACVFQKTYEIIPGQGLLKCISVFTKDKKPKPSFFRWSAQIRLPSAIWQKGKMDYPRHELLKTISCKKPLFSRKGLYSSPKSMTMLTWGDTNFALRRYSINGQPVGWKNASFSDIKGGWYQPQVITLEIGIVGITPEKKSVSAAYEVLHGDAVLANAKLQRRVILAVEGNDLSSPPWVADVAGDIGSWWTEVTPLEDVIDAIKQTLKIVPKGYITLQIRWQNSRGDYSTDGTYVGTWRTRKLHAKLLREQIRKIKAISPRVKVGLYTWHWSIPETSDFYKKHPDFILYDRDGKPRRTRGGDGLMHNVTHYSKSFSPETADFVANQMKKVMDYYDTDFFYVDGALDYTTRMDWRTGVVGSETPIEYAQKLRKILRKDNPERALFFNFGYVNNDLSYQEFSPNARFYNRDWRMFARKFLSLRLATPPRKRIVFLYQYDWATKTKRRYNEEFEPYYISMGVIPGLQMDPEKHSNFPHLIIGHPLVTNLIYRLSKGEMALDCLKYPRWWTDDKEQKECYISKHGDRWLLSVTNHGENPDVEVILNRKRMCPGGNLYLWGFHRVSNNGYGIAFWSGDKPKGLPEDDFKLDYMGQLAEGDSRVRISVPKGKTHYIWIQPCPAWVAAAGLWGQDDSVMAKCNNNDWHLDVKKKMKIILPPDFAVQRDKNEVSPFSKGNTNSETYILSVGKYSFVSTEAPFLIYN